MVLVPKANRKAILEYLFKEGVLTCKKDGLKAKHDDIDVPNLQVMMVMKSMVSRAMVTEKFNWRWHYFFLTNEGIDYLRGELNLPAQVCPATLTKQQKPSRPQLSGGGEGNFGGKSEGGKGKGKGSWGKGSWGKGKGKGKGGYGYEDGEKAAEE